MKHILYGRVCRVAMRWWESFIPQVDVDGRIVDLKWAIKSYNVDTKYNSFNDWMKDTNDDKAAGIVLNRLKLAGVRYNDYRTIMMVVSTTGWSLIGRQNYCSTGKVYDSLSSRRCD